MRLAKKHGSEFAEGDMTPMIDMTFQLIAFFMVLINFTEADQNEQIKLPSSELATPPVAPIEKPITLQLTDRGTVLFNAQEWTVQELRDPLLLEKQVMQRRGEEPRDATVIIRADRNAKTGQVQELIKVCQDNEFEKFALRAKQEETVGSTEKEST